MHLLTIQTKNLFQVLTHGINNESSRMLTNVKKKMNGKKITTEKELSSDSDANHVTPKLIKRKTIHWGDKTNK